MAIAGLAGIVLAALLLWKGNKLLLRGSLLPAIGWGAVATYYGYSWMATENGLSAFLYLLTIWIVADYWTKAWKVKDAIRAEATKS